MNAADDWTLEGEICKLAHEPDLQKALHRLGLCEPGWTQCSVRADGKWTRGGAETYILPFDLLCRGLPPRRALLKACTPTPSTGKSLEATLQEWLERRSLVKEAGIEVPYLYYAGSGLILEEFIAFDFLSVLRSTDSKLGLLLAVARYAGAIQRLRFSSVAPFSDLRSRGHDLVVVDFGSDLGRPRREGLATNAYYAQLEEWLGREGIAHDHTPLWEAFETELSSTKQSLPHPRLS